MKSREVNLWPRDQGRKLFHEFHGRHFDGSGAIVPGDGALLQPSQSVLVRDRELKIASTIPQDYGNSLIGQQWVMA